MRHSPLWNRCEIYHICQRYILGHQVDVKTKTTLSTYNEFQSIRSSRNLNLPDSILYFLTTNVSNINLYGDIVYARFLLEHVPPE